jgi:hypothetical protein
MTSSALLQIRPSTKGLLARLIANAKENNVQVIHATDILERGGEIIGYVSIGSMPTVHMYFDPRKAVHQDYLTAMAYWEGVLARNQIHDFWLPCESTSKLLPFVEKLGYTKTPLDNMFFKHLG